MLIPISCTILFGNHGNLIHFFGNYGNHYGNHGNLEPGVVCTHFLLVIYPLIKYTVINQAYFLLILLWVNLPVKYLINLFILYLLLFPFK